MYQLSSSEVLLADKGDKTSASVISIYSRVIIHFWAASVIYA